MNCEKCGNEVKANYACCPECGAPVQQTIDGFDCTMEFQSQLRLIVKEDGPRAVMNTGKFIGLLYDRVPDHKKERNLLSNMYLMGVFHMLLKESNREIAVMKVKSYLTNDLFIADNAADFVLACFTYLLGWPYESSYRVLPEETETVAAEPEKKASPLNIEAKVFKPMDAVRYRLRSNIEIPEGFTKLENFCFDGFGSMRTVQLPSTLLAIGDYAFSSCKRLKGVDIPETVRVIKQGAFSQCGKLKMVTLPSGILEIEDGTFSFCTSLERIDVPDTVSSIGSEAFLCCESLKKIFLPDSVKFIDAKAFANCPQLVIHCFENSYIHKYCLTNRLRFELVTSSDIF